MFLVRIILAISDLSWQTMRRRKRLNILKSENIQNGRQATDLFLTKLYTVLGKLFFIIMIEKWVQLHVRAATCDAMLP